MKSILLGGLKVWLVNDGGKPLSAPGGRAKFYTAGTSTPETVYSDIDLTEGDAFGPSVSTDKLGYLPAIWLKTDRLYKVIVEQKIQDDPERWKVLWEVDNVGYIDPHESETPGEYPIVVTNMAELKAVDTGEHATATVLGYYSAGDWGEPSTFYFDPECDKTADNGAYVRPNGIPSGKGRWIQVFDDGILDVRKFGAIPDTSENSDVQGKVVNAVRYSQDNSSRTRPLVVGFVKPGRYGFIGNFDFSQYSFTDLTDSSVHDVRWFINDGVVFSNIGEYANVFTLGKDTVCLSRETIVEGSTDLEIEGGGSIKVDPAWWGNSICEVSNCYVECHSVTTNGKVFTGCVIESNGMLGGSVSLDSCGFRQSWFTDGFEWSHLTVQNSRISIEDCASAQDYVEIKNSQSMYDYGDLRGEEVSNVELLDGAIVENAVFVSVTLSGDSSLKDVSGSVDIPYTAGEYSSCDWTDCRLVISQNTVVDDFSMKGGMVGGSTVSSVGALIVEDVEINCAMNCSGSVNISDSAINATVTHSPVDSTISQSIIRCQLSSPVVLVPQADNSVINAQWIGNHASVANPLRITRTKLKPTDSLHSYVYSGNTGTFLPGPEDVRMSKTLNITDDASLPFTDNYIIAHGSAIFNGFGVVAFANKINPPSDHGISGINLFRVGTDSFEVECSWIPYSTSIENGYTSSLIPQTFKMVMKNTGDDEYRACVPKYESTAPDPAAVPETVIAVLQHEDLVVVTTGTIDGKFNFMKV